MGAYPLSSFSVPRCACSPMSVSVLYALCSVISIRRCRRTLRARHHQGEQKDLLFLLTERYKLCVLEYDAASGGFAALEAPKIDTRQTTAISMVIRTCLGLMLIVYHTQCRRDTYALWWRRPGPYWKAVRQWAGKTS
jgi:hypothetical protein